MRGNHLKILLIILLISLPWTTQAGIITIEDVTVIVQPLAGKAYQLFFKFDLPNLPDSVAIDYAVLSFGVNIVDSTNKAFEILSAESATQGKVAAYNRNPVTEVISKRKVGLTEVNLDFTQLVVLWVNGGEKNEGISLVSHRMITEKSLRTDKVILAPEFKKATVKIFYTVIE